MEGGAYSLDQMSLFNHPLFLELAINRIQATSRLLCNNKQDHIGIGHYLVILDLIQPFFGRRSR